MQERLAHYCYYVLSFDIVVRQLMSLVFEKAHTGQKHEQVKKKKQKKHQSSLLFSLSFENKCPQRNNALSTDFSNNFRLNVSNGKYCIVGQAHGFRKVRIYAQNAGIFQQFHNLCIWKRRL